MAYLEIENLTDRRLVFDGVYGVVKARSIKRVEITTDEVEMLRPSLLKMQSAGIIRFDHVNIPDADDDTEFVTFADIQSLLSTAGAASSNQLLTGVINGVNLVFTSPVRWLRNATVSEALYLNGQRLTHGPGNDYVATESLPGFGFDIITMTFAPSPGDVLLIDFTPF